MHSDSADERRDPAQPAASDLPDTDADSLDVTSADNTAADSSPAPDSATRTVVTDTGTVEELPKGILAGNPKLQILLIAAVFYLILIGMCVTVGILVFRG